MSPRRFCKIRKVLGQAQDRHHFGGDRDVKTCLAREAVGHAAQDCCDLAQGAVVHVDNTAPDHAARVDLKRVAPIDVVVDHRRQQVVRRGDRVKVTREMQVHFFHRHDLRIATTSGPALHAKVRAKRRFADTDRCLFADAVQTIAQTNSGGCLALARRRGVDRGDKDQLAVLRSCTELMNAG